MTKQIIKATTMSTSDTATQEKIIKKLFKELSEITFEESAPYIGRKINKYINDELNIIDPYKKIKEDCNILADDLCKELKLEQVIDNSISPIDTACRLTIAGNIIDFSAHDYISDEQIKKIVKNCLNEVIYGSTEQELMKYVNKSKKIMFLADNAGEIVFDKLLINRLPKEKITYVVKKEPIVNDATMKDAIDVKMTDLVRVIDNGSDAQGTIFSLCSKEFIKEFEEADLIISKGQANYETLSDIKGKKIFYLFKAKCEPVANYAKCNLGSLVMLEN
jgi:uncharacterized protein with ATP-grasp and redox domains